MGGSGIGVAVIESTSISADLQLPSARLKALLLVDDEKPEVAERDVLLEQPVRADHDVDPARRELRESRANLGGSPEAGQDLDADRKAAETVAEGAAVLVREEGRGDEHPHLLPVHHRLEGRADRYLRLPVADVPAQKTVHRSRGLHVALHVPHRRGLVRCLHTRREFQARRYGPSGERRPASP
jgi:hypothetical protein